MSKLSKEQAIEADRAAVQACRSIGIDRHRARQLLSEHRAKANHSMGIRAAPAVSPHPMTSYEREILRSLMHSGRTMLEALLMLS
jgi:hypothetical protein